jgi:ribonuclease D
MQRTARSTLHPDDAYLRFNAAARMKEPSLRVLQSLARWREETAISRNRARGFVVSDAALMEMARNCPGNMQELKQVGGLHPRVADRLGPRLLKLIADALDDPAPITRPEVLNERQNRLLKQMRQVVQQRAKELDVEPALLASRKELEKLLHAEAVGGPVPERFTGWRQAVITDDLLAIIR